MAKKASELKKKVAQPTFKLPHRVLTNC